MITDSKALDRNNYFALMHIYRILLDTIAYTGNINVSRESTLIKIQDKKEQTGIYFRVYPDYREPIIICQISGDNVHGKFTFNRAIKTKRDVSFASQLLAIINDFNDEYGPHIEATKTDEYPIDMLKEFSNILILVLNEIKTRYQTSNDEFVSIVNKYPTTIRFEEQERYSMMSDEAIAKDALSKAEWKESVITDNKRNIGPAHVIVLEGLDASGKTTTGKYLHKKLTERGFKVHLINSETVNQATAKIRSLFISDEAAGFTEDVIATLVSGYNTQIIETEIFPRLDDYDFIIVDRLYHSTASYQWRSMIADVIVDQLYKLFKPDTVIFLDISYQMAVSRKAKMGDKLDHFEAPDRYKFNSRRKAYLTAFKSYPIKDTVIIDADEDISLVNKELKDLISRLTGGITYGSASYSNEQLFVVTPPGIGLTTRKGSN